MKIKKINLFRTLDTNKTINEKVIQRKKESDDEEEEIGEEY